MKYLRNIVAFTLFFSVLGLVFLPINVYALIDVSNENTSVNAKAAMVMEASTGEVLFAQNESQKLPMASTTKIMTALLTLESESLDEEFIVDSFAIKTEGSSMGLCEGDVVTLSALAGGMLSASGNDAANAAAVKIAGSNENFAVLMNERAKKIGMQNTSFTNPSGLPDDKHYSTAYDMALLGAEAIKNQKFLELCSKPYVQLYFGNPPYKRSLKNHNRLLGICEGCIGIKTGFTEKAGRCLVSATERDGITLICVTLNCPDDWNTHTYLYNKYFPYVEKESITQISDIDVNVVGGESASVSIGSDETAEYISIKNTESQNKIITKIYSDNFYYAPIKKGDIMGRVEYYMNDVLILSTNLIARDKVEEKISEKKNLLERLLDLL